MIWGPKHKFLHFSEWFEGKKHSQHQFFKKGQYSKNMQIYFKGFNKTSPQNEPLKWVWSCGPFFQLWRQAQFGGGFSDTKVPRDVGGLSSSGVSGVPTPSHTKRKGGGGVVQPSSVEDLGMNEYGPGSASCMDPSVLELMVSPEMSYAMDQMMTVSGMEPFMR